MKAKQAVIWGVVVLAVIAIGVLVSRPAGTVRKNIENAELTKLVGAGALLVDVRSPAEYAMGIIPGAINVEYTQIAGPAAQWDKSKPVVVYCASGSRSLEAAATLVGMGFQKVYNLTAGIQGWVADGGSIVAPPASAAASPDPSAADAAAVDTAATSTVAIAPPSPGKRPVLIEFFTNG